MKHYTICNVQKSKLMPKAILSFFIGGGILLTSIFLIEMVWWARLAMAVVGIILALQGFYDFKYLNGLEKTGFTLEEGGILSYYNEFEGEKSININTYTALKVFKRNRRIYLLEFTHGVGQERVEENVNVNGLYQEDVEALIESFKQINPIMKISKNN